MWLGGKAGSCSPSPVVVVLGRIAFTRIDGYPLLGCGGLRICAAAGEFNTMPDNYCWACWSSLTGVKGIMKDRLVLDFQEGHLKNSRGLWVSGGSCCKRWAGGVMVKGREGS